MASFARFTSELRSTFHRMFQVSSTITTILGRWTVSHPPEQNTRTTPPTQHRATASSSRGTPTTRKRHGRRKSRRTTTTTMTTTTKMTPTTFPIMELPTELRLSIFEHCTPTLSDSNSKGTFSALLNVSKTIQHEVYIACLPKIPIALWSKKCIESFRYLLERKPELCSYIRYLWIGTGKFDDEETKWAIEIIRSANQLRSLACSDFIFSKTVSETGTEGEDGGDGDGKGGEVGGGAGKLAESCTRVSLMNTEKNLEYVVKQVTQLRVCIGMLLDGSRFPNLQSLSFNIPLQDGSEEQALLAAEQSVNAFKKLSAVATIGRDMQRLSQEGLGVKSHRQEKVNLFKVVSPAKWTEWDVWSADSLGTGVWDYCRVAST